MSISWDWLFLTQICVSNEYKNNITNKDIEQKNNHLWEKLKKVELILEYPHSLLKRIIEIGIEENSLKKYKQRIEKKLADLLLKKPKI